MAHTSSAAYKPALVIHLDINKTLVMTDPAASTPMPELINSLLSSCAWGFVDPAARTWTLASTSISVHAPEGHEGSMTYDAYIKDILYPYKSTKVDESSGRVLSDEEHAAAVALNVALKEQRRKLINNFTEPGYPGEGLRPQYDQLLGQLLLTPEQRALCPGAAAPHPGLASVWEGRRFLLPAYFNLLIHLLRTGRRFLIVFRTMGHDLVNVACEHNAFVAGVHPLHPWPADLPRSAAEALRVPMPEGTAAFSRHGDKASSTVLSAVLQNGKRLRRKSVSSGDADADAGASAAAAAPAPLSASSAASTAHVGTVRGIHEIHDWIDGHLPSTPGAGAAVGLRDDYAAWFAAGEVAAGGKLFTMSDAELEAFLKDSDDSHVPQYAAYAAKAPAHGGDVLHMFFDDNIGAPGHEVRILSDETPLPTILRDTAARRAVDDAGAAAAGPSSPAAFAVRDGHIVDPRGLRGEHVSYGAVRDVTMVRVDPISPILNHSYFIQLLQMCEANAAARIAAAAAATVHGGAGAAAAESGVAR